MLSTISSLVIPLLVLLVVLYGIIKKVNIYDVFVDGSTESFDLVLTMFPCLLGMIFGVNIFLKSGVLDFIFKLLEPFFSYVKVPIEIFIQGSTDTTFYILTLYFGSIGIKKIRYALWSGLFADILGIIAAVFLVNLMF